MDWADWEPTYRAILADFGYAEKADLEAARLLDRLLQGRKAVPERELRALFEGKAVVVAGPALRGPLPRGDVLVATDTAVGAVGAQGAHPDAIVTDLDGDVEAQVKANACCALAILHAHGDNIPALRRWVPRFQGRVVGTAQCEPPGVLFNPGGFTDGDRACVLAAHFGAARLVLAGFDLGEPVPKEGKDPAVKRRKLAWARRIIEGLGVPVEGL